LKHIPAAPVAFELVEKPAMSNVIDFLEMLARNPRGWAGAEIADAAALLAPDVRAAVEAGDAAALGQALQVTAVIACYIKAPDEDEPVPQDVPADGDEEPIGPDTRAA
jgi:hypothetical protein